MQLKGFTPKDGLKIGKVINQTIEWILNNNISLDNKKEIENYIKNL